MFARCFRSPRTVSLCAPQHLTRCFHTSHHRALLIRPPTYASSLPRIATCEFLPPRPAFQGRAWPFEQRRRASQYQKFGGNQTKVRWLFRSWAARPTFYIEVGGVAIIIGAFYTYNLEEVPISGRRRFNIVTAEYEEQMAQKEYSQLLKQYRNSILPERDPRCIQVRRVLDRLLPASGLSDKHWDVHVIASEEPNAFVLPSGKVFVFTGILPICRGDEGIAAVLGHEIAHVASHHAAEGMSQVAILILAAWLLEFTVGLPGSVSQMILEFAFHKPGSRRQESEADYIGLMMMAQSCFNPESAVEFWSRMEDKESKGNAPPQLLSTHPSSHNRRTQMEQWLPEAFDKLTTSECGALSSGFKEFQATTERLR